MAASVIIVAAYAAVRAGLRALLAEAAGVSIAGEVVGSDDLARALSDLRPDVVLFDYAPEDAARVLDLAAEQGAAVVMLGEDPLDYRLLAGSGLRGWAYLLADAEGPEIAAAIGAAAAGLVTIDPGVAPYALETPATDGERDGGVPDDHGAELTAREREVLQLMARGLPNKTIAARLGISLHTVKFHVAAILAKLGATSRTEAVTLGLQRGDVVL